MSEVGGATDNRHGPSHAGNPMDALPSLLADADIGLVPSLAEPYLHLSLSTKLLEYAAMGVPTIAGGSMFASAVPMAVISAAVTVAVLTPTAWMIAAESSVPPVLRPVVQREQYQKDLWGERQERPAVWRRLLASAHRGLRPTVYRQTE